MLRRPLRTLVPAALMSLALPGIAPAVMPLDPVPVHVTGTILGSCGSFGGCAWIAEVSGPVGEPRSVQLDRRDDGVHVASAGSLHVIPGQATVSVSGWNVSDVVLNGVRELESEFARCTIPAEVPNDPRGLEVTLVGTDAACLLEAVPSTRGAPTDPPSPVSGLLSLRPLPTAVDPDRANPPLFDVEPGSVPGIPQDVVFSVTLGHCGLWSPIDVDGSVWDPIGGLDASGGPIDSDEEVGELINATPVMAVIPSTGRLDLRTPLGSVVVLSRHDGPRGYPGCD